MLLEISDIEINFCPACGVEVREGGELILITDPEKDTVTHEKCTTCGSVFNRLIDKEQLGRYPDAIDKSIDRLRGFFQAGYIEKIPCIQMFRCIVGGVGLKEAKDTVDSWETVSMRMERIVRQFSYSIQGMIDADKPVAEKALAYLKQNFGK